MKYLDDTGLSLLWSKMKGLIPSSLPANGGNADTVDGKHASDFAASDHKHYVGTTAVQSTSANQALSGISNINFVADGTDSSYIGTTVSGAATTLDFYLSDDKEADYFRWLFKYWDESNIAVVMQLHHTGVASTALKIYDKYVSVEGHTHTFASLTDKPTTLSGYGILDAYTKDEMNTSLAKYLPLTGGTLTGELTTTSIKPSVANTYSLGTKALHYATVYARNICGENGSSADISHQIALGYSSHDRIDFDEWGGAFYFNKTSTGARVEIASILSTGATFTMPMNIGSSSGNLNSAIKLGPGNAKISYFNNQVIFNTADALRFGHTDWDWDKWAGLGYDATNKIISLGLADGSTFQASNAQSGGTLNLVAVDTMKTSTGKLTVSAATTLSSTLNVTGATTLASTLSVTGATSLSGKLDVSGVATLKGRLTCSNLTVTKFISTNAMTYGVKILSWLTAADEVKAESTLEVAGATTLSSTLTVNGSAVLSDLTCSSLSVTGSTSLGSTLKVTGDTTLAANLSVGGTIKADTITPNSTSAIFIGDPDNGDALYMVEDMAGWNGSNMTWQLSTDGYLSGLGSVSATNATIGTLTLTSGLKIQASSTKTYTFNMAKAISLGLIS